MIIQTNRLVLRAFKKEDIDWYFDLICQDELRQRLPNLFQRTKAMAKEDIDLFINGDFKNDFYYVITDKTNNVLGIIIAVRLTGMIVEISYYLYPEYRHKGYMHETLEEMFKNIRTINIRYSFLLIIKKDNISSLNVAKQLNMEIYERDLEYLCYI